MTRIIQRHDTAANWASVNPILAKGEMGVEDDTRKFKFGDGATSWADLAYASSEGGGGGQTDAYTKAETDDLLATKQDTLVSGTNIKTINGNSILGEGNLVISGGEGGSSIDDSTTSTTTTWSSEKVNSEISTVKVDVQNLQAEVVTVQGDVASLDADVSTLNGVVGDHTTSIAAINDSVAQLMEDIKISDSNTISVGSSGVATYSPYTASGGITINEDTGIATIPTSGAPQLSLDFTPVELAGHAFEIQTAFKVRESAPFSTYVAILQEAASYANRTSPQIFIQANGNITFDIPNADGTGWLIGDAQSNVTVSGGDTVVAKLICDGTKITSSVSKNGSTPVEATIYNGAYVRTGTVKFMYGEVSAYAAKFASTIESIDLKNTYVKYDGEYIWQPATDTIKTLNVKVSSESGNNLIAKSDGLFVSSTGGGSSTSYTFTDGIVNNNNVVGLDSNLYSKSLTLNTVGTPTLSDKFVGGRFTASSHFTSKSFLDGTEDSWEMCLKFDFSAAGKDNQGILDSNITTGQNIRLTISSANKLFLRINSTLSSNTYALNLTGSTTLSINTVYYVKIKYSSSTGYEMYLSTNGTDYTLDASSTNTAKILYSYSVVWIYGSNIANVPFTGNIYFEDSYILRNETEKISFVNIALKAITPANTITSENIASDTTIVNMNDAIEMAQGDITTLSTNMGGMKLAKMAQTDYDALATKDENTMYIVTGDGTVSIYIGSIKIQ